MAAVSQRVLAALTEVEAAAEDVLSSRHQIVDLDAKRNGNREALNALKHEVSDTEKVQVCFGSIFIKLPKSRCRELIERDQEQLQKEVTKVHQDLKVQVQRLNQLQGKAELRGFSLSPLTSEELKSLASLWDG